MASPVYFDRNAIGTGSGGNPTNAISDPAIFRAYAFAPTTDTEFRFANGAGWPFTTNKVEPGSAGKVTLTSYDNGSGSTQWPYFYCYENAGTIGGWIEIDPAYAVSPNTVNGGAASRVPMPGSKLWHTNGSIGGNFVGAYRLASGELKWGRRCRMLTDATGAPKNAPAQDYAWGEPTFGGLCVYLTAGNPDANTTVLRRPAGVTDSDMWTFNNPIGGFEMSGLEFAETDFALTLQSTGTNVISGVNVHHNKFRHSRKGFALYGPGGTIYTARNNGGFFRPIFAYNKGYKLGQMLFHAYGNVAVDQGKVYGNIARYTLQTEGAGTVYMDQSYCSDGSWFQVFCNWFDNSEYDGKYWLDGSALYGERCSQNVDWWGNYFTNCYVAAHVNIGTGPHRVRNNVAVAGSLGARNATFLRIVNATGGQAQIPLNLGYADVSGNIADRFSLFAGAVAFDYTGTGYSTARFLVHHNIARGRRSLDTNDFTYPIQGNEGTLAAGGGGTIPNRRMVADRNNFTDYFGTTVTAHEYDGALTNWNDTPTGSMPVVNTSRASNASIMSALPATDNTREDINYAMQIPQGITTGVIAAPKPALVPAA